MAGIVFCGVKLKNMLTEIDLTNLGLMKKAQHFFGFVDQENMSNTASHILYQVQNSRNPIPITSLNPAPITHTYQSATQFNNALKIFTNKLDIHVCYPFNSFKFLFSSHQLKIQDQPQPEDSLLPIEITAFQHVQYYLHQFSQDLRDIEKSLDILFQSQFFLSQGILLSSLSPVNLAQLPPTHPLKQDQLAIKLKFVFQCITDQLRHHINQSRKNDVINQQLPNLIQQFNDVNQQLNTQSNSILRFDKRLENFQSQLTNLKLNQSNLVQYSSQQSPDITTQLQQLQSTLIELIDQRINSLDQSYSQLINQLQNTINLTNNQITKIESQLQQQISQVNNLITNISDIQLQISFLNNNFHQFKILLLLFNHLIDKLQQYTNSRLVYIETSVQQWYQQQQTLNETLIQNSNLNPKIYQALNNLQNLIILH
ncbi:hypothetical protein ABPG72_020125 [Tetrahymena utriculariae]